jgi:hypothetical protein
VYAAANRNSSGETTVGPRSRTSFQNSAVEASPLESCIAYARHQMAAATSRPPRITESRSSRCCQATTVRPNWSVAAAARASVYGVTVN